MKVEDRVLEGFLSKCRQRDINTHDCSDPGCYGRTREGKPYCIDHVGQNPYVRKLLIKNCFT